VCLKAYDAESEYPEGSGCFFTQYYFPEIFPLGFRLENNTDLLFEAFNEIRQESGLFSKLEIPMQYLTLIIEYVLKNYGMNKKEISKKDWKLAIDFSGYIDSEKFNKS